MLAFIGLHVMGITAMAERLYHAALVGSVVVGFYGAIVLMLEVFIGK